MDKIFVGKVDVKEGKYGELVSISFGPQDFEKLEGLKNEKGWISLNLKNKKDGGKYLEVYIREEQKKQEPVKAREIPDIPF